MPRNGSGVYSLPAGVIVANGQTIDANQHNPALNDFASDANTARPIVAGGTGGTSATEARTNLGLGIGTNVQAFSANLSSLAGLTLAANKGLYSTGANTLALFDLTAAGRTFLGGADAAAQRGLLELGSAALLTAGTSANNVVQLDGDAKLPAVDASQLTDVPFPAPYESGAQTITSAGLLTLTHGLGSRPRLLEFELECVTDEAGFTDGQFTPINPALNTNFSGSGGMAIATTSTQILVRFGNNANAFIHSRLDTGAAVALTNANWRLHVRAWK
jgi:hypothetical protein